MRKGMGRIVWVDWAKAFAIFFVVVGHVGLESLRPFVYAFHVPAFFVLSGYLYKKAWWFQTFLSFVVPVLAFSALYFIMSLIASDFDFTETWTKKTWFVYKLDETRPMFTGLWFLEVLFVGRLLLGDGGFDFIKKNYILFSIIFTLSSVVIDALSIELNWYITRIIQCFPFLGFGIYLKESNLIRSFNPMARNTICMAVGGGILFLVLMHINQWCDIMYNRYNSTYIVFFINAVLGSLLLFYICLFLKRSSIIEVLSIGTLVILGCHDKITAVFLILLHIFYDNKIFDGYISPIISVIISYFVIKLCQKIHPLLLGKIKLNHK